MVSADPTGSDWTSGEIDLIVADYFDMLSLDLAGATYVKAHRNSALQELTGRSRGSIEFKHQNISAVLLKLGLPWLPGYKPMSNFQNALIDGVERFLTSRTDKLVLLPTAKMEQLAEEQDLFLEAPPQLQNTIPGEPTALERLARKFDPAARDAKNRDLGKRGEERVLKMETAHLLRAGFLDLARRV